MTGAIRQLCALAVFCGAVMSFMPEGGVRRMAAIGCTAAMLLSLAGALRPVEPEVFAPELGRYHELEQELTQRSDEARDRFSRSVIEAEYEAYVCDEAARLGVPGLHAQVTARWDLRGLYLPWEARLSGTHDETLRRRLAARIEAELGIPGERIIWNDEA